MQRCVWESCPTMRYINASQIPCWKVFIPGSPYMRTPGESCVVGHVIGVIIITCSGIMGYSMASRPCNSARKQAQPPRTRQERGPDLAVSAESAAFQQAS